MSLIYPATSNSEAVDLNIDSANRWRSILVGDVNTLVETFEGGGTVPSISKAIADLAAYKSPIAWEAGAEETDLLQPRLFSDFLFVPTKVPAPMDVLPSDSYWKVYLQSISDISGDTGYNVYTETVSGTDKSTFDLPWQYDSSKGNLFVWVSGTKITQNQLTFDDDDTVTLTTPATVGQDVEIASFTLASSTMIASLVGRTQDLHDATEIFHDETVTNTANVVVLKNEVEDLKDLTETYKNTSGTFSAASAASAVLAAASEASAQDAKTDTLAAVVDLQTSIDEAIEVTTSAEAAAHYIGEWSSLSGAATVPTSVLHNDEFWHLVYDIPDITLETPGVSAAWVLPSQAIKLNDDKYSVIKGVHYVSNDNNIIDHGIGSGPSYDLGSLKKVIDLVGGSNAPIEMPDGAYNLGGNNVIIPENIEFRSGAGVNITNGSISVNGPHRGVVVNTVADLRNYKPTHKTESLQALGYWEAGDGGGGGPRVGLTGVPGTFIDNKGTVIASTDGSFAWVLPDTSIMNWKEFGAKGDNTADDTAAIQAAVDAMPEFGGMYTPPGRYRITDEIDLTGKKNFSWYGEFRGSKVMMDTNTSSGVSLYNESFTTGGVPQRGIHIKNISFYPSTTTSEMPLTALKIRNCPEIKIDGCTLINAGREALLSIDECWSAVIEFNFLSARENLFNTHGAVNNLNSGGVCILNNSEDHNMVIRSNRIRTGTVAGISYGGGDACEISFNAIEGNTGGGIHIKGSSQSITIKGNYFEGGSQPIDIRYFTAGTCFAHTIENNYFHAVIGIQLGSDTNTLKIVNNEFYSGSVGIRFVAGLTFKGIISRGNLMRENGLLYDFSNFELAGIGLVYPNNRILIDDNLAGTFQGPDPKLVRTPYKLPFPAWDTISGSGTAADSGAYHNGIQTYDITAPSVWNTFNDYAFDDSMKNSLFTICVPLSSNLSGNKTILVSDGITNKAYTCNSTFPNGGALTENLFYYKTDPNATRLRVQMAVGPETIRTLVPTVRRGFHDNLEYFDIR